MHLPKPTQGGGDFEPAPEGLHPAVCTSVIDLGTQERINTFKGGITEKRREIMIRWELDTETPMADGRPFIISRRYPFSMHEKAKLREHLEGWRGKKFVEADFGPEGFTLDKLLADPGTLRQVLTYHVVPGKVMAADVKTGPVKSVQGAPLALSRAGTFVTVEDGAVIKGDIQATNGVIHVIDSVLLPPLKKK